MNKREARRWIEWELAVLRKNYWRGSKFLSGNLLNRSAEAIRLKANELGLSPSRTHWTAAKVARLHKLYEIAETGDLLAAFPGETLEALRGMAKYYGLKRPKRRLRETGYQLVDQIRSRAQTLGHSMSQLDRLAGETNYFYQANWNSGGLNHRVLAAAAEALGGVLVAVWDD